MALQTFSGVIVDTDVAAHLTGTDDAVVTEGAVLVASEWYGMGIWAEGTDHDIDIHGTIFAGMSSLYLGTGPTVANNIRVKIHENGVLNSTAEGVFANTSGIHFDNAGNVSGGYGIEVYADGSATSTIINSGSIISHGSDYYDAGVVQVGSAKLVVDNTGLIKGLVRSFNGSVASTGISEITNSGAMLGDVLLGGGNDLYDGRLGMVDGIVSGGDGEDIILGGAGDETIQGGASNDTLDGGAGADAMTGGSGNDSYVVDDAGDVVTENADAGTDTVNAAITFALAANVEKLVLTGTGDIDATGNDLANTLTGNDGDNSLDGGAGGDTMAGGAGDDSYVVDDAGEVVTEGTDAGTDTVNAAIAYMLAANVEDLVLTGTGDIDGTGNGLDNDLTGNAGNNVLDGGAGSDTMAGDAGNDTYFVNVAGDLVVEGADAGTDTLHSSVAYALTGNVEKLVLTGSAALNGTGNGLANTLTGNGAANTLNGGVGADRMEGGTGNDICYVDNSGDRVIEAGNAGTDTVRASVSHTLADNVENLVLTGSVNINGTGNGLANTITGNGGKNTLKGSGGNDILNGAAGADGLFGGAGTDDFVFRSVADSTVAASGRDTIFDFSHGQNDDIVLSAIDATKERGGNQAFTFIGDDAFSDKAGELRFIVSNGDTVVQGDVNGDGKADFAIRFDATINFVRGDFIL